MLTINIYKAVTNTCFAKELKYSASYPQLNIHVCWNKKESDLLLFSFLSFGSDYSLPWRLEVNKIGRSPTKKNFRGALHAQVSWKDFDAWPDKKFMLRECGNGQR